MDDAERRQNRPGDPDQPPAEPGVLPAGGAVDIEPPDPDALDQDEAEREGGAPAH